MSFKLTHESPRPKMAKPSKAADPYGNKPVHPARARMIEALRGQLLPEAAPERGAKANK